MSNREYNRAHACVRLCVCEAEVGGHTPCVCVPHSRYQAYLLAAISYHYEICPVCDTHALCNLRLICMKRAFSDALVPSMTASALVNARAHTHSCIAQHVVLF